MVRTFSNLCFVLAVGTSLGMKWFNVQNEWVGLAVCSVLVAAILTHCNRLRSMGLVGIGGFSMLHSALADSSPPAAILTILSAVLLGAAVLLAVLADGCQPPIDKKEEEIKHDISF